MDYVIVREKPVNLGAMEVKIKYRFFSHFGKHIPKSGKEESLGRE